MNHNGTPGLVRASEAATLALHSAVLLARTPDRPVSTQEIAESLEVSRAHLAKVLLAMERTGLVTGTRGPGGGFRLSRSPDDITLKEIYEAIEGRSGAFRCPMQVPACDGNGCLLGSFFRKKNVEIEEKLAQTRLSDVKLKLGGKHGL